MIYNGIDLGGYLKVYGYSGVDDIPISETIWSPTLGDGGKISLFRRPTLTITVSALIETDDVGTLDEKIAYLRTIFTAGKDFVPIVFDERDPLTRRGRVTGFTQSAYYFTIAEYKITFVVDPYRYGDEKTVAGSGGKISGTNAGTASALGKISFTVAGSPATLTVTLAGTTGAVQLVQPANDTLDGAWVLDLDQRTVYLDGALAMQFVSFANTTFETFEVAPGAFEIDFSAAVTGATYSYVERNL